MDTNPDELADNTTLDIDKIVEKSDSIIGFHLLRYTPNPYFFLWRFIVLSQQLS